MSAEQATRTLGTIGDSATPVHLATAHSIRLDAETRRSVALWMMTVFGIANAIVLIILIRLIIDDHQLLVEKIIPASARTVDATVLMALIAGTTTQLGALAFVIAKYLFPPPKA